VRLRAAIGRSALMAATSPESTPGRRAWCAILAAASTGYRAGIEARSWAFASGIRRVRRLPRPVICIGNLTVGGSGKTPCAITLAQWFRDRKRNPGILLRGYGRRGGGVAVAGDERGVCASWEQVGDEAVLLANRLPGVPVVVGGNRFRAGQLALRRFAVDVLLLDDGFQHRQLHRELDLVMVDATDPFGGGRLLPRGLLREPLRALRRAHVVMLSRSDQASDLSAVRQELRKIAPSVPQVLTRHRPIRLIGLEGGAEHPLSVLRGRRTLALSGIANPEAFHRTLAGLGSQLVGRATFPDHHPYAASDLLEVRRMVQETDADLIITTEKDAVRLPQGGTGASTEREILVLQIELEITEGAAVVDSLLWACAGRGHG